MPAATDCMRAGCGNPHVRFDEGGGERRSLACGPLIPCSPLVLYCHPWSRSFGRGLSINRQNLGYIGRLAHRTPRSGGPGIAPGPIKPTGERTAEDSAYAEILPCSISARSACPICGPFNLRRQSPRGKPPFTCDPPPICRSARFFILSNPHNESNLQTVPLIKGSFFGPKTH